MGKLSRDKRDVFYRKAKESGYRARSAYKLLQIDAEFDLFGRVEPAAADDAREGAPRRGAPPGGEGCGGDRSEGRRPPAVRRAVDLCAAPGGWSQVLAERMPREQREERGRSDGEGDGDDVAAAPAIVAVDLWPIEPLPGVRFVRGDITSLETARAIIAQFRGERAELVVCDGAPDVTGRRSFDEYVQSQLLMAAVNIATHVLAPGGTFVAKVFRGADVGLIYAQLQLLFGRVTCAKPTASRNASIESFVVCQNFGRGKLHVSKCLDLKLEGGWDEGNGGVGGLRECPGEDVVPTIVPFVACTKLSGCNELLDSDKSYDVKEAKDPLAPPIQPPYEAGMAKAKEAKAAAAGK